MTDWEACHSRVHPASNNSPWPHPPTIPVWGKPDRIFDDSNGFDIDHAMAGSDESELDQDPDPNASVTEADYGEAHRQEAKDAIRVAGIDAVAFYAPIHNFGHPRWGIYLNERVFYGACAEAKALLDVAAWEDVVADMLLSIDRHELFHAAVELFSLVLEDFADLGAVQQSSMLRGTIKERITDLIAELHQAVQDFGCDPSNVAQAADRFKVAKLKVEAYSYYLGDQKARLEAALQEMDAKLRHRIDELVENKAEVDTAGACRDAPPLDTENSSDEVSHPGIFPLRHACPFRIYFTNEYLKTYPSRDCVEEGIATALEFHCKFKSPGFRRTLVAMLRNAPPAYSTWRSYICSDDLRTGVQSLAQTIVLGTYKEPFEVACAEAVLAGAAGHAKGDDPRRLWFPGLSSAWLDRHGPVPRWIYRPDSIRPRRFARAILANVRLRDLLSGLERRYNARIESGGKHSAIHFPNGKKVPYPTRRNVPPYLIRDIAQALGVTKREILSNCLAVNV